MVRRLPCIIHCREFLDEFVSIVLDDEHIPTCFLSVGHYSTIGLVILGLNKTLRRSSKESHLIVLQE